MFKRVLILLVLGMIALGGWLWSHKEEMLSASAAKAESVTSVQ